MAGAVRPQLQAEIERTKQEREAGSAPLSAAITPEQRLKQMRRDLWSLRLIFCEAYIDGCWARVSCSPE